MKHKQPIKTTIITTIIAGFFIGYHMESVVRQTLYTAPSINIAAEVVEDLKDAKKAVADAKKVPKKNPNKKDSQSEAARIKAVQAEKALAAAKLARTQALQAQARSLQVQRIIETQPKNLEPKTHDPVSFCQATPGSKEKYAPGSGYYLSKQANTCRVCQKITRSNTATYQFVDSLICDTRFMIEKDNPSTVGIENEANKPCKLKKQKDNGDFVNQVYALPETGLNYLDETVFFPTNNTVIKLNLRNTDGADVSSQIQCVNGNWVKR